MRVARSFPRLPVGSEVAPGVSVGRVLGEGPGYQLVASQDAARTIWIIDETAPWLDFCHSGALQREALQKQFGLRSVDFGGSRFLLGVFPPEAAPVRVGSLPADPAFGTGEQLFAVADALRALKDLDAEVCWSSALYLPDWASCVGIEAKAGEEDRLSLAIRLLTGGVADPGLSPSQIRALNRWISPSEVREFFDRLGLSREWRGGAKPLREGAPPEEFALPGRPALESLFREYVIDFFRRRDSYETMGIKAPNGILLVGPPGTGKTYDASPKATLGPPDVSKGAAQVTPHFGDVVGATVGETPFGVGPDGFVGVELRGIGRKELEMQPREPAAEFPNPFSFVNGGVVPDHDDVPAEVAQQVPEELADLAVPMFFAWHWKYKPTRRRRGAMEMPEITEMRSCR